MTLTESFKRMITRDKSISIDKQMTSLNNEIDAVQQKIGGINEQIEQFGRTSSHRIYVREESLNQLAKAQGLLRASKEHEIEKDATREIERVTYQRSLEDKLKRLEQEIPAQLTRLAESAATDDERRVELERELGEHQAVLRELQARLRVLQDEQNEAHQRAGEDCYNQLLQGFNELAGQERELIARALEAKAALLKKSEEATRSLGSWPGLARKFSDETAQIVKVSQSETIDSSDKALALAKARRGGMIIGESV